MPSLEQTAQLAIDLLKKYPVSDYEIALSEDSGISTLVRLGKVETLQYHLDKSFEISVYIGQKKGHASSVDLSPRGLDKTIQSACLIAQYMEDDPFNGLAPKDLMAFEPLDLDLNYPWDLSAQHSIELATECEALALEQKNIDNSEGAEVASFQGQSLYANSHGLLDAQNSTRHSLSCALIAKSGADQQTAYEYTTAIDPLDLRPSAEVGLGAAKLAQEKLGQQSLASQKCPVIFTPSVSGGLFSQLLGAISGTRQYNQSTFLPNSIGQIVLPETVNILENPHVQKTIGARVFDGDGALKRKQYFVQNGIVKSYVMGQYSAHQLGLKTTANAGGVSNALVSSNFAGGLNAMIKNMHQGLVITELMGQGVNATTGDYSRGAIGFWVENGKIQRPVSGFTIAGNLKQMLRDIEAIGTDIDPRRGLKVGSVLLREMTIAGDGDGL